MYEQEKSIDFIRKTKEELNKKPFGKFLVLGGFAATAFNGLIHRFATLGLVADVGIIAGVFIGSEVLKNHSNVATMSEKELNQHIAKSAFLMLGSLGVSVVASLLPSSLSQMAHYPTSIGTGVGLVGLAEGLYHKMKK